MHRTSEQSEPSGSVHPHWITVQTTRTVLVVVHTITAWNRLSDILPTFDSDRRVQLVFTFPDVSNVTGDVERQLGSSGAKIITWDRALTDKFDLAISVHHSGDLHKISAPLAIMSHGMGYSKIARESGIGNRESGIGNRESGIGNRESGIGNVYGLGREWLVRDGSVPAAVVLSHVNDRQRLTLTAPEALPNAVVAGDPCYDRMQASSHYRHAYRAALGARADTTVVTVSSTWGPGSLLGQHPDLINDLLSELTLDNNILAAVVHPNVWFAHGPLQLRTWLADAVRSGLRLIPPIRGWQQTVLASDVMVGDHGAVTSYAAAQGIPTLLAAFPHEEVATGSAPDILGDLAPTLHPLLPLPGQIAQAITTHDSTRMQAVTSLATSRPGACLDTLRSTFYELLNLSEPDHPAPEFPYAAADLMPETQPLQACWVACEPEPNRSSTSSVRIRRWPADVTPRRNRGHRTTDACLVVHEDHPRRDLNRNADIIVVSKRPDIDSDELLRRTLQHRPSCSVAVVEVGPGRLRLRHRVGGLSEAISPNPVRGPMPTAGIAATAHTMAKNSRAAGRELTMLIGDQRISFALKDIDSEPS
ncbi:hypothetical protein ACTWPB_06435 [Nocardia sp. IBHARD005]|uniref:hypothetical protein n=1 Tax=Nocardia sp. IBHARD005 TaxID=3457765 RepID=UPI004058AD1C